jgi:WD40 repeat protein
MGVVYHARQIPLDRESALKMILAGAHADSDKTARFLAEAKAFARLTHPNVVQIYSLGEVNGLPFLELEYVDGGSLDRFNGGELWEARRAARLVETLSRAIAEAHRRDLIHRDLKPSNILMTRQGVPKIADFGLVKALDDGGRLTTPGEILGTASYMAPEQASGRIDVGPQADIHALGAILYELVTGRPPFRGPSTTATLDQVRLAEPVPPCRLVPNLPRDLETIILECLQKEPGRRYQTAIELADDLARFREGRTILARPATLWERGWRWCRRNPMVASLAGLVFALLALLAMGASAAAYRESEERRQAQILAARTSITAGTSRVTEGEIFEGLLWFTEALKLDGAGSPREMVHRMRLGAILEHVPTLRRMWFHAGIVNVAAFSPDGRFVLTAGADGIAYLWDTDTGQAVGPPVVHRGPITSASFSPDGSRFVTAGVDGIAQILSTATGLASCPALSHDDTINAIAFSPDGHLVATAGSDGTVRIWDVETGQPVHSPFSLGAAVRHVAFSPDGRLVAAAVVNGSAKVWNVETGEPELAIGGQVTRNGARRVRFSPDSRRLVIAGLHGPVCVIDVATGDPIEPWIEVASTWRYLDYSPNGSRLVIAGSDGSVGIFDAATGKPTGPILPHYDRVWEATFSTDGRLLITTTEGGSTRVWDAETGRPLIPPLKHNGRVHPAMVHPDGHRIITAGTDGAARIWEARPDSKSPIPEIPRLQTAHNLAGELAQVDAAWRILPHRKSVRQITLSSEGRLIATASEDHTAQIWNAETGDPISAPLEHPGAVGCVAFSPDGRLLATGCADGSIRFWDARTGQSAGPPLQQEGQAIYEIAFSPDGRLLVSGNARGVVRVWDVAAGIPTGIMVTHQGKIQTVAFSPDGQQLLTASVDRTARIWDPRTGAAVSGPFRHVQEIQRAGFSPDGQHIVTASDDGTAQVWDVTTGKPSGPPLTHNGPVFAAVFSPDGCRVATASRDGTARVWDAKTGEPISPRMVHTSGVLSVAFSLDGLLLATASDDRTARVWDAETGEPVSLPLKHGGMVFQVSFSPDDRRLLTACLDGAARIWKLAHDDRPTDDLLRLARLLSGYALETHRGVIPITPDNLQREWVAFLDQKQRNQKGASPISPNAQSISQTLPAQRRPPLTMGALSGSRPGFDPGQSLGRSSRTEP